MVELNLTTKEVERCKIISEVEEGELKVKKALETSGLRKRPVYRIKAPAGKGDAGGVIIGYN